jgi:hypothetical protein
MGNFLNSLFENQMGNPLAEGMVTHNLVNVAAGIFATDPNCFDVL